MAENFCAKDRRVMPVCQLPPDGLTLGRLGKDYDLILDDLGKNYRAARGQLFSPGAGAVGQGKRHGEEELLDQAGGKFLRVDLRHSHASYLFHRVIPEPLRRLTRVKRPIAQSVELGVNKPVFWSTKRSNGR